MVAMKNDIWNGYILRWHIKMHPAILNRNHMYFYTSPSSEDPSSGLIV